MASDSVKTCRRCAGTGGVDTYCSFCAGAVVVTHASPNTPQPAPSPTDRTPTWELVIADMRERDFTGRGKYGMPLTAGNGRDSLVDAYQEALDLAVYLRNEIEERKHGR